MIPQRVELKGFLCYKDEQEVRFDGAATLWMLSGLNGSGKSSIFDAVTYALFGHHRGGGQHAHELINKDSDALLVEFDFLLDGKQYRAKRTLRRNTRGGAAGTQQIFRREGGDNGDGKWVPIEGTGQKREFDAWVAEHVGLTYETFTSSVLLLQGKAEKLLDSKPEGRREVLAGIVDLERYERLHKQADDQRKALEGELKGLNNRLDGAAGGRAAGAGGGRRAHPRRGRGARAGAGRGGAAAGTGGPGAGVGRLAVPVGRRRAALAAGGAAAWRTAADIEKDVERLRELRDALPRMQVIAEQRNEAHKAEEKVKELDKAEAKTRRGADAARPRPEAGPRQEGLDAGPHRRGRRPAARRVRRMLRQRSIQLEKLKEYERHEGDLERLRDEKKRLPEDPAAAVARARESFEALTALAQNVPLLTRLASRRDELRQARDRGQAARRDREAVETKGIQIKSELETIRPRLQEAEEALRQAADQAAEARTVVQQARDALKELTRLDGSKVCRHCGQALTEGHSRRKSTGARRRHGGRGEAEAGDAGAPGGPAARAAIAGGARPGGRRPARICASSTRRSRRRRNRPRRKRAVCRRNAARSTANCRHASPDARRSFACRPTGWRRRIPRRPTWSAFAPKRPACRRRGSCCSRRSRSATSGTNWRLRRPPKSRNGRGLAQGPARRPAGGPPRSRPAGGGGKVSGKELGGPAAELKEVEAEHGAADEGTRAGAVRPGQVRRRI